MFAPKKVPVREALATSETRPPSGRTVIPEAGVYLCVVCGCRLPKNRPKYLSRKVVYLRENVLLSSFLPWQGTPASMRTVANECLLQSATESNARRLPRQATTHGGSRRFYLCICVPVPLAGSTAIVVPSPNKFYPVNTCYRNQASLEQ
jgi:hypothetical protein